MKRFGLLLAACALVACGGNSSDDESFKKKYAPLSELPPSQEKLRPATEAELQQLLKNGVRLQLSTRVTLLDAYAEADGAPAPVATPEPDYSTTNVQVENVDEADHVKYDGHFIYMLTSPDRNEDTPGYGLRILSTDTDAATASEVSFTPLPNLNAGHNLYLLDANEAGAPASAVVHLSSQYASVCYATELMCPYVYSEASYRSTVSIYGLDDPANPSADWTLELDGALVDSRRIGNYLYLVTRAQPALVTDVMAMDASVDDTEQRIEAASLDELLPHYRINGGESRPLHQAEDCWVNDPVDDTYGIRMLHDITVIDLAARELVDSLCASTPITGLYSSLDNLYFASTQYRDNWEDSYTVLHKFHLDDGVSYAATGAVPGNLGWSSPGFRMDEKDNLLRVVSSVSTASGQRQHQLWVLQENTDQQQLEAIAKLPNEEHPEPIGKPNEDIYAVRFYGDQAYVVTFLRMDPFYVLDLSEADAPVIAGSLELPGFSRYLHPLAEGFVFGFGETGSGGLKAALFDVRDPAQPVTVGEVTMGDSSTWSDALYDYKALSFQRSGDRVRVTLPVTSYGGFIDGMVDDVASDALTIAPDYGRLLVLLEIGGLSSEQLTRTG